MSMEVLTSLAAVKAWLNIVTPDDDALLSALISQVSRALCNLINRPFLLPCDCEDIYNGSGSARLLLRNWPVISISSVIIDGRAVPQAIGAHNSGWILEAATPQPPGSLQTLYLRGFAFTKGVQNISISYCAGYQMSNEVWTIPTMAPYQIQAAAPYGSWAKDRGVAYRSGAPLALVSTAPNAGQYSVDSNTGLYRFSAADAGAVVMAAYGYIPADLEKCALEWIADSYRYRDRIGQSSKSFGGQETASFRIAALPPYVGQMLPQYSCVVAV